MKAPWNFARFLPLAGRLLAKGRLPTLLFAVASKSASQGGRLGKLKDDLRLLQALCLAYWRGEYRAISRKSMLIVVAGLMYFLSLWTPFRISSRFSACSTISPCSPGS